MAVRRSRIFPAHGGLSWSLLYFSSRCRLAAPNTKPLWSAPVTVAWKWPRQAASQPDTGDRAASCQFSRTGRGEMPESQAAPAKLRIHQAFWRAFEQFEWVAVPANSNTKIAPLRSNTLTFAQGIPSSRKAFPLDLLPATGKRMTAYTTHMPGSMLFGCFPPRIPHTEFVLFSPGENMCFSPYLPICIHAIRGKTPRVQLIPRGGNKWFCLYCKQMTAYIIGNRITDFPFLKWT